MIRRALPGAAILSQAERDASLTAVLAARPAPGDGVWLFAYGSLIWNPVFEWRARRVARIAGWHRAFCLSARGGRGTPEHPALLLGLMPGGACTGAAFCIGEDVLARELDLVWRREMVTGAYIPRWLAVEDADGATFAQAIAFTINPDAPTYAGELPHEEVVRRIAAARGPLGSCADYLFHTRDGLHRLGIADSLIDDLARDVRSAIFSSDGNPPAC